MSPLAWLFGSRRTDLRSALTPEQCVERLKGAVDSPWALFGKNEVAGWVRPAAAWVRKRSFVRNSFRPVLRLTWQADGRYTAIVCRCGMSPWVAGFTGAWLGLLVLLTGLTTLLVFTEGFPAGTLAAFPILLAFVVGLVAIGRLIASGEEAFLLTWATRTLDAGPGPA